MLRAEDPSHGVTLKVSRLGVSDRSHAAPIGITRITVTRITVTVHLTLETTARCALPVIECTGLHSWNETRIISVTVGKLPVAAPRDGRQINSDYPKSCQAPESKIFRFRRHPNHRYHFARPPRQEGRIAIVTNAGLDAVDAAASGAIVIAGRVLP